MKWTLALALCLAPQFPPVQEAEARPNRLETEHLTLTWVDGVEEEVVAMAETEGERFYAALEKLLGHEPSYRVTVLLRGPAEQPDGSWGVPHVDRLGRVHLFQYTDEIESNFNSLAHELVHAFRFRRAPGMDRFFEEAFAEFVALRVHDSLDGFPWYGFPIAVAAGQWFELGEAIPLTTLRANHRGLNLPCKAQSYTLRAAFFDWLGRTDGDETVLNMAAEFPAGILEDYESYFGADLESLEAGWRDALMVEYEAIEGVDELTRRYREETPVQYMQVCKEGQEF